MSGRRPQAVARTGGLRIQAVILDLDDTMFDHLESARRGIARLIDELGATPTPALAESWLRNADALMERRRAGEFDRIGYRHRRVQDLLAELHLEERCATADGSELDRIYGRFIALYEEEWVGFEDAVPTLEALDERGVPVAVLTNGPEERQQRKARMLGIEPLVTGVWTSERLGVLKPEPRAYLAVCETLDVAPENALHVGDNLEFDLHGALAAGLQALHLDRRRETPESAQRITGLVEVLDRV